jgi:cellulose synthase/poly-beta-1,6-N-acetylglucosamine synthase-like glycosyltransferase
MQRIDIIVPSYGRPEVLQRCLKALLQQSFADFGILCVCRVTDSATRELVAELQAEDQRVREVLVDQPGFIEALNTGLGNARAEFVAFTDDDAEAPPHWIETIITHFDKHAECGAVGGPDRLQLPTEKLRNPAPVRKVGVYSWTGKWQATHHCPIKTEFVKASILKGVNMTYRHDLIRGMEIGEGLLTRTCTEPGIAAQVRRAGYELHFVRDAWVLHHCAPRLESDDRTDMTTDHALKVTYNYAYVLWRYQPYRISCMAFWYNIFVGSRFIPGILRLPFDVSKGRITATHLPLMLRGALSGIRAKRSV